MTLTSTNGDIYNYDNTKTVLLAKYNLDKTTGLQTSSTTSSDYAVRFSGINYWYDSTSSTIYSKYGSSYNKSNIYDKTLAVAPNSSNPTNVDYSIAYYVEGYISTLGLSNVTGRLLTYTEANGMSQAGRTNGQSYWSGSADGSNFVKLVLESGGIARFGNTMSGGVRPVIVVNSSDIGA